MPGEYVLDFHFLRPRAMVHKACGRRVKWFSLLGVYSCEECNAWVLPRGVEWRVISWLT
jgi:hypothetical protein